MITTYIIYFFVLSAAGYVYETIAMTIWGGKWDNRGFFYGPLIPIYGAGALGGTLLFTYFIHDNTPLKVFLIGMIASAVLALIIIVICILLGRRKNKKKKKQTQQRRYRSDRYNDEYDDIENW